MIADLIAEHGEARVGHLADQLGISHASVSKHLQKLDHEGLVEAEPRRRIKLTESGRAMALRARERHRLVVEFLQRIGVPEDVAEIDAEGIEHHVSAETISAMEAFLKELKS